MIYNPLIFREYDIRGEYKQDFDEELFYKIARGYATVTRPAGEVVVGRDDRLSSPSLTEAVIRGLQDEGANVIDIGVVPIGAFYYLINAQKLAGGLYTTASHLPKEFNGLKMQKQEAYPVMKHELERIKELVERDSFTFKPSQGELRQYDPIEDYVKKLKNIVKLKRPLKILIDTGNGAVGKVPERILAELGCEVETMYARHDGNFPKHTADPYEIANLTRFIDVVTARKFDLGLAFDTDGDRLGIFDNFGTHLTGDQSLFLLATDILEQTKGVIVFETRTSQTLVDLLAKKGAKVHFTIGHHKAILDEINKSKAIFGGETTGHVYFPRDYYLVDDAIVYALKICELVSKHIGLTEMIKELPKQNITEEIFIPFADDLKFKAIARLQQILKKKKYKFLDIDGARITFDRGWGTVRAANTSAFIKCKFEGDTPAALAEILSQAKELMAEAGIKLKIPK